MARYLAVLLLSLALISSGVGAESRRIICTMPKGTIVHFVKPTYPREAAEKNTGGVVELTVSIDEQGVPTQVRVKSGDATLAQAAVDAVRQWRWRPLKLNGTAVPVETVVSVNFKRKQNSKR